MKRAGKEEWKGPILNLWRSFVACRSSWTWMSGRGRGGVGGLRCLHGRCSHPDLGVILQPAFAQLCDLGQVSHSQLRISIY